MTYNRGEYDQCHIVHEKDDATISVLQLQAQSVQGHHVETDVKRLKVC